MSKKTNWEKRTRENRERMERHEKERNEAAARAAKQHQAVDGLHPISLPSLAEELDEVDPHVRAALRNTPAEDLFKTRHRTELEDRATEPIAAPYRKPDGSFVPPRHNPFEIHREESKVQNSADAKFSSNERVKPQVGTQPGRSKKGKPIRPFMRLKVPADIVEAVGVEKLEAIDFEVELTEDGILYRPAGTRKVDVPSWAKRGTIIDHAAAGARR